MNVRIFGIMKINDKLLDTGQIKRKIKKKSAVTTTYQLSTVKSIVLLIQIIFVRYKLSSIEIIFYFFTTA